MRVASALVRAGVLVWAVFGAAAIGGGPAAADDVAGPAKPASYVPRGGELDYVIAKAPVPVEQIARVALTAHDRARGVENTDPDAVVLGSIPAGVPPAGWPTRLAGDGARRGAAPLQATDKTGKCVGCGTVIGDVRAERVAVIYASRRFMVGDEAVGLRLLRLHARFADGLVAYINGREVARRNVATDVTTMGTARRPHGPEWETFYIPVTPGLVSKGENWLALEVRPSGYSLAPRLDVELEAAGTSRLVRGPILQRVGPTSAVIVFDTDLPTTGTVEFGQSAARGRTVKSAGGGLAVHHVVELTGLAPGKAVHYRVIAGGDVTSDHSFHTTPGADEPIRFAVYGDVRGGHRTHAAIAKSLLAEAVDFIVVTGDMVLRGSDEGDWQRFFSVTGELLPRIPYYPVAGNHDMGRAGDELRRMNEIFALWPGPADRPSWGHWYSFDVADLHFVMLDSNAYEHGQQREWLKLDLARARKRGVRAIFAAVHAGPYSRAVHQGNKLAREHYAPILAKAGVTLLFSGHDHIYQRGRFKGLDYIVSGGGGAPLYSIRCGVRGKRRCPIPDGSKYAVTAHHYVVVEVFSRFARVCAKKPDRSPLEPCVTYRLPRRSKR